jgi:hypothetical protein
MRGYQWLAQVLLENQMVYLLMNGVLEWSLELVIQLVLMLQEVEQLMGQQRFTQLENGMSG